MQHSKRHSTRTYDLSSVASGMRFTRDHALIRVQTWILLKSAATKLYANV